MYASNNTNYGATSTLIYGTQWDTALKFIGAYGGDTKYATYSGGKGNLNETYGGEDIASTSAPAVCGAREAFRQKNIYDMAGNVDEWTVEQYNSTDRVTRGATYKYSQSGGPAATRAFFDPTLRNHIETGFRVALYIK